MLVFPSMSGGFAFPLLTSSPERVAGVVPVAPVGIESFAPADPARLGLAAPVAEIIEALSTNG